MSQNLTRKERRRLERLSRKEAGGYTPATPPQPVLHTVKPITMNQSRIFKAWSQGHHLMILGYAGTGKSYLASYLALREMELGQVKKVVFMRSAVPSRKQGFLPGTEEEKAAVFEAPYRAIVDDLYRRSGTYARLKDAHSIEFETTSYLRGITIPSSIIIVDEVQNLTDDEMNTVMTRPGEGTRVILCGDFRQGDLKHNREESCIQRLTETIEKMPSFTSIEMEVQDIVRSGLVKEWIIARG